MATPLTSSLAFEQRGEIGFVRLARPAKRNALSDALPRIAGQPMTEGFLTEALMAATSSGAAETKERMQAFLDKRAGKVGE
jgi:enoyl-CoA hydratase/carnithine racemase